MFLVNGVFLKKDNIHINFLDLFLAKKINFKKDIVGFLNQECFTF